MKKAILAILLATSSLTAFATEATLTLNQPAVENATTNDSVSSTDDDKFFYLHCRISRSPEGLRRYEWCRHEERRGGITYITRELERSEFPPLPPEAQIASNDEEDGRIPTELLLEMEDIEDIDPAILKILGGE